jgi:hypothetical protein
MAQLMVQMQKLMKNQFNSRLLRLYIMTAFVFMAWLPGRISAQIVSDAVKPKLSNWQSKQDRLVLDINLDNWNKSPDGVEVKTWRSRGVNIMFTDEKQFGAGNVAFAWGIGFSSQNFHTNGELMQDINADSSYFSPARLDTINYDLNKLSLNYLDIPLELRFRTNANAKGNRLKLALGFKLGVLLNAHTKFDDGDTKVKTYHLKNIPDLHYGLTARLGFGHIGVSYFMSLTTLFNEGEGKKIFPYSIGLSFTP